MSDLIDRQAAIDALYAFWSGCSFDGDGYDIADKSEDVLRDLPSVEPECKNGKWIPHEGGKFVGFPYMHYECSECRVFEPTETNFCPNCGAKMKGGEENE